MLGRRDDRVGKRLLWLFGRAFSRLPNPPPSGGRWFSRESPAGVEDDGIDSDPLTNLRELRMKTDQMPPLHDDAAAGSRTSRRVGLERLVLVLVMVASSLSLISYRFHFFVRNYDTFIVKQVIPTTGLEGWLARTFGYNSSAYNQKIRATLGSPYYPEYELEDGTESNPTASDYLGIWFYTREIINGRNPYAISQAKQFRLARFLWQFQGTIRSRLRPDCPGSAGWHFELSAHGHHPDHAVLLAELFLRRLGSMPWS